jgi:SRSO17 transposase
MLSKKHGYDKTMLQKMDISKIDEQEINIMFEKYIKTYNKCLQNESQRRYFETFERGLLSNLDRKSIEPIALTYMEEKDVRGFQQFFSRSSLPERELLNEYQKEIAKNISMKGGFISVDGSDFAKKGNQSVGVARQHCGRLGKTENCQAGVFISYASEKGYGLLDKKLYIPKAWFTHEYEIKRNRCGVPKDKVFKTKNQMALEMIQEIHDKNLFNIQWIGCDAAFGNDHKFLRNLPEGVNYFAATHCDELVFLGRPEMKIPLPGKSGCKYKHPRPSFEPVKVKTVAMDDAVPWERRPLAEGVRGTIYADVKCIRCVSCESTTKYRNYLAPGDDIWLYIRRYENGDVKYYKSNAPLDTPMETLNRLSTMRWSIEQCFQECKSYLGMSHYETRTYDAWNRHMLMVMIAHLFTIRLRLAYKKTLYHDAYG